MPINQPIVKNYDEVERNEALKDALNFLEENQVLSDLNAFLKSQQVTQILKTNSDKLIQRLEEFKKNAPEELLERADSIFNEISPFEVFEENVLTNFKIGFKRSIVLMMDCLARSAEQKEFILNSAKESLLNGVALEDFKILCKDISQIATEDYLETLYLHYVPKGFPLELAAFIRAFGGGSPIIPVTAIFPDFAESLNNDDSCDSSDDNNADSNDVIR